MKKITKVLSAIILALTLCLVTNHQTQAKEQLKEIVIASDNIQELDDFTAKNIIKKHFKFDYTYHPNKKVKSKKANVKFILTLKEGNMKVSMPYQLKYTEYFNTKGQRSYYKEETIANERHRKNKTILIKKNYKMIKNKNIALYQKEELTGDLNQYKIITRHNNGKLKQVIDHDYEYFTSDVNDINDYRVIKKYNKKGLKTSQKISTIHGKKLRLKSKTKYHSNGKKKQVKAYKYNKKKKKVYLVSKKSYTKKGKLKQVKKYNKKGKVISNKLY